MVLVDIVFVPVDATLIPIYEPAEVDEFVTELITSMVLPVMVTALAATAEVTAIPVMLPDDVVLWLV